MSRFTECVTDATPRLGVLYGKDSQGQDAFQWGVVGKIPLLSLLGAIGHVQSALVLPNSDHECDQMALVITWRPEHAGKGLEAFDYFVHPSIPTDCLCGMLETVKAALVNTIQAKRIQNQQIILGPDGNPIRK